ncbi:MAG: TIGR00282 family metallophosphoesterase [Eubacteriales bacterium]|nr:TIGR00282 family metallophosphoesterase [Eubacteriales bacterium]MDD4769686.1 TIGR00282 family metallophosphoesterase [Eubacteriales bacterium]
MRVLFIGDIVGRTGRNAAAAVLPRLAAQYSWDLCIANAENAAGGRGITPAIAQELLAMGIDVLTMGNHTWDNKEIFQFIDQADYLVRPANYPVKVPGQGYTIVKKGGKKTAVLNLSGQAFMDLMDCPFAKADELLAKLTDCDYIIVDFHGEATAEKVGFARYLDGRVAAVIGTHTHIQTADEQLLPKGTLYITDVGATGAVHSVLGMEIEPVLKRLTTKLPQRFVAAKGPGMLCAVLMDLSAKTIRRLAIADE